MPTEKKQRSIVMQWLMSQMGGVGPMHTSDDNPRIDTGAVDSAPEEPLKGYQPVLAVHEHTT